VLDLYFCFKEVVRSDLTFCNVYSEIFICFSSRWRRFREASIFGVGLLDGKGLFGVGLLDGKGLFGLVDSLLRGRLGEVANELSNGLKRSCEGL